MARGNSWSDAENTATVAKYMRMLELEISEQPYKKSDLNAELQAEIGRSRGAIEYKFQNISAVLLEMHHPIVTGYAPAVNYQASLRRAVELWTAQDSPLERMMLEKLSQIPKRSMPIDLVAPPVIEFGPDRERLRWVAKRDYVAIEMANSALGLAGERAVVRFEKQYLENAGRPDLATAVEHVSLMRGDGLGYDVLSYFPDGKCKYVEVKTTRQGIRWPMLISRNEVSFSKEMNDAYFIYRIFGFETRRQGMYQLRGDASLNCHLDAMTFQAVPFRG